MKPIILVTDKQYGKGRAVYESAEDVECRSVSCEEEILAAEINKYNVRAVIVGVEKYSGSLYPAISGGLVSRFGVGYDGIDRDLCRQHNVMLTNTPGVLDRSVAEHAVWLMGCLARDISAGDRAVRAGTFPCPMGEEIFGKSLLLVGFGRIARLVAHIAGCGLGMNVLAYDVTDLTTQARAANLTEIAFLEQYHLNEYSTRLDPLLARADFVSLHMPSTPQTYHFFDARKLAMFKKGAFLINTARGAVLDERDLFDALRAGHLAAAALDVFEREPYVPLDPSRDLRTLDNVILTPHSASNTRQASQAIAQASLANCRHFLAGRFEKMSRVW